MCNSANCRHNDALDDDLDGLFDGPAQPLVPSAKSVEIKGGDLGDALLDNQNWEYETARAAAGHRYTENCPKCRGTGRFIGYTGRDLGQCFECKGKGTKTFKTSPEDRAKAMHARERQKEQKAASLRDNAELWKTENADDWAWMAAKSQGNRPFDFAISMIEALEKYGALTDKQHAAVVRLREKDAERQAQWAKERAERDANKVEVQIDRIAEAFAVAKSNLIDFPKLRLAGFIFSLAPLHGKNAGAIYVKSDDGVYLGKVVEGRFTRSRDCTDELEQGIVAAAADPEAAASAYGLQTGICSCCGRKLTNKDSVGLGIGPICRGKWGW